ncbi:hypothetical protein EW145_g2591 [Phellinidium pouzarii]|uniref:Smr domain-containing protein n=1 Tax=Phellinidium pouzarii TaxID=167371 RepID=A0A4S4LA98_9AGAM|nr:hypothetical protein EW145_g2591 [Phellinidium pouzarii]
MSLLSVKFKAPMTCITTALRSLAGQCGAFDVPSEKSPPDIAGGSLDSVRDWPALHSYSASSDSDSSTPTIFSTKSVIQVYPSVIYPPTPPHSSSSLDKDNVVCAPAPKKATRILQSTPRDICTQKNNDNGVVGTFHDLATPPHTPNGSLTSSGFNVQAGVYDIAAHDFIDRLFPGSAHAALSHAKSVRIASSELAIEADESGAGFAFEGVILDLPGRPRTLYIDGKDAENVKLRESIVALLDLADEHLECSALVIALERSSPGLGGLLHSFMYTGATVVTRPPFTLDDTFVLVEMAFIESLIRFLWDALCGSPKPDQQQQSQPQQQQQQHQYQQPVSYPPHHQQQHYHQHQVEQSYYRNDYLAHAQDEHYVSLRRQADETGAEMGQLFGASREAYEHKDGAEAKRLSEQAKALRNKKERLHREAADWIFQRKGIHSQSHHAVLKPRIEELMQKHNIVAEVDPENSGVLVVHLDGRGVPAGRGIDPDEITKRLGDEDKSCIIM